MAPWVIIAETVANIIIALADASPTSLLPKAIFVINTAGISEEIPGPPAVKAITRS